MTQKVLRWLRMENSISEVKLQDVVGGGFAVVGNRWRMMCSRNEKLPMLSDGQAVKADVA